MFNIILDRLPEEYEGYLLRTDFRIGMQICVCLADNDLNEYEKAYIALELLYGYGIPNDFELAYNGLKWFINCGKDEEPEESQNDVRVYDFEADCDYLYSAFRRTYGIDLKKEKIHWFEFVKLFSDLGECALTSIMQLRCSKDSDLSEAQRKSKRRFELKESYSAEELEAIRKFAELSGESMEKLL